MTNNDPNVKLLRCPKCGSDGDDFTRYAKSSCYSADCPARERAPNTPGVDVLARIRRARDVLAEIYVKHQIKIGPFATQAQQSNVELRQVEDAVAELIAERDRLANTVRSHEVQIIRALTPTGENAKHVEVLTGIEASLFPGEAKEAMQAAIRAMSAPDNADAVCSCPSGDGSLRWPCAQHRPMDAIDVDNGFRKYPWTYRNQPGNVGAWALGECAAKAKPGGDYIDRGLSLLQQLHLRGLGIVRVPALAAIFAEGEQGNG